jgi:prepilin-type processing-associated H-X9-DG protein
MNNLPRGVVSHSIFACPGDPTEDTGSNGLWLTSYSLNANLVGNFNTVKAGYSPGWTYWLDDASGLGHFARFSNLRGVANLALIVCGAGDTSGGRRLFYQGTTRASRVDCSGWWHNRGSTMLFCDGHASRLDVNLSAPIYHNGIGPLFGYLFDLSIQVTPKVDNNTNLFHLPRIPY